MHAVVVRVLVHAGCKYWKVAAADFTLQVGSRERVIQIIMIVSTDGSKSRAHPGQQGQQFWPDAVCISLLSVKAVR